MKVIVVGDEIRGQSHLDEPCAVDLVLVGAPEVARLRCPRPEASQVPNGDVLEAGRSQRVDEHGFFWSCGAHGFGLARC